MLGHFPELIIVLVLALVFFGPEKLPEIANSAGKMVGELRNAMNVAMDGDHEVKEDEFATYYYDSMQRQSEDEAYLDDLPDPADEGVDYPEVDGIQHFLDEPYGPDNDEHQILGEHVAAAPEAPPARGAQPVQREPDSGV